MLTPDLEATLEVAGVPLAVRADRDQTRRMFLNLLLNAVQAIGPGGRVRVDAREEDVGTRVRILDDGPGVPPDIRGTLFEPYVTRREGGTGLGLAIARRIADEHGWQLACADGPDGGAMLILTLPRRGAPPTVRS